MVYNNMWLHNALVDAANDILVLSEKEAIELVKYLAEDIQDGDVEESEEIAVVSD